MIGLLSICIYPKRIVVNLGNCPQNMMKIKEKQFAVEAHRKLNQLV